MAKKEIEDRVHVDSRWNSMNEKQEWRVFYDPPRGNIRTVAIFENGDAALHFRKGFIAGKTDKED